MWATASAAECADNRRKRPCRPGHPANAPTAAGRQLGRITGRSRSRRLQLVDELERQRCGGRTEVDLDFPPHQLPMTAERLHTIVGDLGVPAVLVPMLQAIAVSRRANRGHRRQPLARPDAGQPFGDLGRHGPRRRPTTSWRPSASGILSCQPVSPSPSRRRSSSPQAYTSRGGGIQVVIAIRRSGV